MLCKKYLKEGMRAEARKTADIVKTISGSTGDRTYFLYRLMLLFPFDIVKHLIALKKFFRGSP